MKINVEIDGAETALNAEPRELLGQLLRDQCDVDVRLACETSTCGACTVLLDGDPVKSCAVLGVMADGQAVTTGRGLVNATSFAVGAVTTEHLPCGECLDAVRLVVASLTHDIARPSRDDFARALSGTVCRCTGYQPLLDVLDAAVAGEEA